MSEHTDPSPYELEKAIVAPDLTGSVIVRPTHYEAIESLAADLLLHAHNCVRSFGDFHCCISGDGAIEPVLLRVLTDPVYRELPWRRTHLWCFAERIDDAASEYELIHETVAVHADLPREQVHTIVLGTDDPVRAYEKELRETLAWREKGHDRLDYALLAPSSVPTAWGASCDADALVDRYRCRVACTNRLINASRLIAVYAAGAPASGSIASIVEEDHPLASLDPIGGALRWYLDEDAISGEAAVE